jgi:hypothetical protein
MNIFDAHISGSLSVSSSAEISNNLLISGNLTVLGTISGSISGSITNADTANRLANKGVTEFATTGSNSFNGNQTVTGSIVATQISSSFTGSGIGLYDIPASGITGLNLSQIAEGSSTASISSTNGLRVNTNTEITGALTATGQISGSFKGDGTNLYNIPASGVTGLNLTQIADGGATASISSTNGLRVNSNTEITGTLKLSKVKLGSDDIVAITLTDAGGKYYVNGVKNPRLSFIRGLKYRFYFDNNNVHPLLFSLTNDGEHNGGTVYTTGVTTGSNPFYVQIEVTDDTASTLYYFCDFHVGMGNSISVYSDFLNGQSSINLTNVDTGMFATTASNNFIGVQRTSGSLAVTGSVGISGSLILTGSVDITGSMTLNGEPIGTGKLDETIFNSYTTSSEGRFTGVETSTGSLNTFTSSANSFTSSVSSFTSSVSSFTSSIDTTIKNKLNTESVISGSIQINITETTGYSTVSSSIGSLSSSVATTTSGLSSSIGSLSSSVATTTSGLSSSIGSLSSSVDTTIGALSSSFDTTTNTLSSSIGSLSSSIATTTVGISSSLSSLSSSVATTTLNLKNRVDSIETSTGSLNSFTSSINTTIKDKMNADGVLSGSITFDISVIPGFSGLTSGVSSSISSSVSELSGSLTLTVTNLSSSLTNTDENQNNRINNLETSSGSLNSFTSSINTTIKSKLNTDGVISGSVQVNITETTNYSTFSSSIATTDSNQNSRLSSIEGNRATTGSNIFQGNQTITGSLFISENLIVVGSSSIQHISSSIVNIADNIITVNAINPSVRFGGLAVIDSGSSPQVSGSMLFDSVNNQWLFVHQDQSSVTSSVLLMGPETYNNLGGEAYLTLNRIPKGTGIEHLNDSNITDTGIKVSIDSNTEITGTLKVTGNITNPNITAIETSTGSLNTFTSSVLAAVELTGSNLTVKGNLIVKGTTTNVNITTLDVDNNLINLNGTGATSAGLRVKDTTGPSQVSGSLLWDSTNDYWIAGQLGSEQRLVRETEFNNAVTRVGNIETSTGSLNSFTSSINTTIKSKLNTDGVISGSVQVNHNATTNYVANQHIDHTAVSITAGSGLTGGGDISTTRTINVGAGNGITVNADDIAIDTSSATFTTGVKSKLNADGVISGSAQVLNGTTIHSGSFFNGISVVSGSAQIDGSLLGSNKTITIGSTSTTLGGTSTSLAGLTSVTSTAFTGSLQGLATSETLSTVTGRGASTSNAITINYSTGGLILNRPATSNYVGIYYQTAAASKWFIGLRENLTSNNYICYSETLAADVLTLNQTTGVATFGYNMTAANFSGTSSGTNTGDETLARVNALAITTVGTIGTGVWNGSSISTTYTAAKVTSVSSGTGISVDTTTGAVTVTNSGVTSLTGTSNQVTVSANTGGVTLSLPQSIATTSTPTFAGVTSTYLRSGTATSNLVKFSSGAGSVTFGNSFGGNATDTSRTVYFRGTSTASVWWGAPDVNGDNVPHGAIDSLSTGGLTHWYNSAGTGGGTWTKIMTVDSAGVTMNSGNFVGTLTGNATNITASSNTSLTSLANLATVGTIGTGVWNGSSIATTYTAAKVTAVNAGTGVGVDTTTGSVTVSIGQAVATSSSPTFAGLALGDGIYTYNDTNRDAGAANYNPNAWARGFRFSFANASSTNTAGNYSGVLHFHPWDGTTSSTGDASYQLAFGSTVSNGGGTPQLRLRKGIDTTWNSWYTVPLKATASFSAVSSVTVTHNFNTKDVLVMCYDNSDNMFWPSNIATTSVNVVTITFASNRTGRVVIIG